MLFKTYLLIILVGAVFAQDVLSDNEDQFEASASEQDLAVAESAIAGKGAAGAAVRFFNDCIQNHQC